MPGSVPSSCDITGLTLLEATSVIVNVLECFNKSGVENPSVVSLSVGAQLLFVVEIGTELGKTSRSGDPSSAVRGFGEGSAGRSLLGLDEEISQFKGCPNVVGGAVTRLIS